MSPTEDSNNLFVAVREGNLRDVKNLIDIYGLPHFPAWENGFRLLCEALECKQSKVAAFLLKSGAKIRNSKPLRLAAINGDKAIAKEFLTHAIYNDLDVDAKDNHGKNLMFYAAQIADFPMFKLLLDRSASVKYSTGLLSCAVKYDCIEIVQVLLNEGMSANDKGETGENAIWYAIDNLNLKMVRLLLANNATISENLRLIVDWRENEKQIADALSTDVGEVMMNKRNNGDAMVAPHSKCKLLQVAVDEELIKVVRSLLDDGADINCKAYDGLTPLSSAVYKKNEEMTRMLLTSGANASNKAIALSHAVEYFHLLIVRLLLEHNADVNTEVQCGLSVLHYSVLYYSSSDDAEEIVSLLLQFGADVNVRAADGSTALHSACEEHLDGIVMKLLRHGANANIAMNDGETALHSVYRTHLSKARFRNGKPLNNNGRYLKVVEMLLEHGAHVNSRDDLRRTLLHLACVNQNIKMVEMLLRYDANVNITDASNKVPISTIIASSSSDDTISFILTQEIVKLVSMGLKVNDQNLKAINSKKLIKFKLECEQEIALLKDDVFDEAFISFYDILIGCTNSIVGYMRHDPVMQVVGLKIYKSKYPIYGDRIAYQLDKALEMQGLLEKASVILHGLTRSEIPEDCMHT